MKLLSLKIEKADACGGLLDGLFIQFREDQVDTGIFDPLCLVGPNGSGKSQVLQVIAEIFQSAFKKLLPEEERGTPNDDLLFEILYLANRNSPAETSVPVRIFRRQEGKRKPGIEIEAQLEGAWIKVEDPQLVAALLPAKVIGYTSGDNETLSLPFFSSRAGYAGQVRNNARDAKKSDQRIQDPRLLLIDYGTNLEVLVASLLLNPEMGKQRLLESPDLKGLRSFRCIVQLSHAAAPYGGVKLTQELKNYITYLECCATCFDYNEKDDTYIFDFFVDESMQNAFAHYWVEGALDLYSCFHKLAMLNDLVIPKAARDKFDRGVKDRRFAARLPEPIDEQKVFRFEQVAFLSNRSATPVDYVSLSDGEHQLAQILSMASMASLPNILFLLDEPESHFNPLWRVQFIKMLRELPTNNGMRSDRSPVAQQECLISTHSPFLPSDMKSDNVLIFGKMNDGSTLEVRHPRIQTYGSTFDAILDECFGISPPISNLPRDEIDNLIKGGSLVEIKDAMGRLGDSVEKLYLADRMRMLVEESKR